MSDTFLLPCPQWAERLAALHPQDLPESEQAALAAHITTCPACTAVLADYQRFAEQFRHMPDAASQSTLPPRLRALWGDEEPQNH